MRRIVTGACIVMVVGGQAVAATAAPAPAPACERGIREAATRLVGDQASLVEVSTIAGLDVATVMDPRIAPGFTNALLRVGGEWCSVGSFNRAAAEQLAGASRARVAAAFASVAAMPYLGNVVVSDVVSARPAVTLTTTGGRHGAESRWTVAVDDAGVRSAGFTTTRWDPGAAVLPAGVGRHADGGTASIGDLEGITSLPGHTRTFTRAPDGRIAIDATVQDLLDRSVAERQAAVDRAALIAGVGPGDDLKYEFEDGLTIKVSYGLSPYTPDAGVDTGVAQADRLRTILAGVVAHYKDFIRWGVDDPFDNTGRTILGGDTGLPERAGYINVDSPLAPVCLACSYLADAMEVHIALLFPELAPVLVPVSYPDSEKFVQTVIGHEMVHSLQGGYSNAQGGAFTNAFIEGSARASESLHDNAPNSFQTGAIHFNDSGNGCEGFENGRGGWIAAQAVGPFNGHTYDACYFWWTYLATHGPEGLIDLIKAMPEALATSSGGAAARNIRLLEVAAEDGNGALDLARWGAAVAAGNAADGYTIPAGQTGDRLNWFSLLNPAQRAVALQASQTVSVSAGGVRAYLVAEAGEITGVPAGALTCLFENVNRELRPHPAEVGTEILPGDILTVVAPVAGSVSGALTMEPRPVEPPDEPREEGCG